MRKTISVLLFVTLFLAACTNAQPTPEPTQTTTAVIAEVVVTDTAVSPTNTPSPSQTPQPTATNTSTPIPTPTVSIRVLAGTAVPQPSQPITPDNVTQLTELARWGRGVINDIDLSGNGRWIAVGTATGVYIHDAQDLSQTVFHLETPTAVESVAISPDGRLLAVNPVGELIQVWDIQANQLVFEKMLNPDGIKFSPNGEYIILNSHQAVRILHTNNGELIKTYPSSINAEFSPDQDQIAVWSLDGLSLYKWLEGSLIKRIKPVSYHESEDYKFESLVGDAGFITEDELIMSALPFNIYAVIGDVLLQKVSDGSVIFTTPGILPLTEPTKYVCNDPIYYGHPPINPQPHQMEISPGGQTIAFVYRNVGYSDDAGRHTSIRFYQRETEQLLYSVEEGIVDIEISPNGETWVAGLQNGRLQIRSLSDGSVLQSVDDYDAPILKTAVSPDNELVAVEYLDEVKIFCAANGTVLYHYPANRIAFSPDRQTFALGYDDGRIEIRSLTDNTLLKTIFGHTEGVTAVTFLPSGELVSAGLDCKLQIWQPETGAPIKTLENYIVEGEMSGEPVPVRVWDLPSTQNDELIVGEFAWGLGVWNVENGLLLNVPELSNYADNITIHENKLAVGGSSLLLGSLDAAGQFSNSWGGDYRTSAIAFSPDGNLLTSGSESRYSDNQLNGALRIFLANSGELLHEFAPKTDSVTGLAFAENGRFLVSTTIDGIVRIWGIP